ncbi:MAG: DUF4212 domain-containing protein [Planctomycetota bacterium]|nr:DUF4212 domain-containing protein [Planctomycetota bacterium]
MSDHPTVDERDRAACARHWQRSLRLIAALLSVWFAASFGCGILLRETLDQYMLPGTGFPLGFWFAQQGAIVIFVGLIGAYVLLASRIDAELDATREAIHGEGGSR